ncbi:MAG: ABC transporter permease subunit [Candidatus Poribacteria bacterium]|nr:ABC transporter permease subunit [Candidatus Poribacteria bacterium]
MIFHIAKRELYDNMNSLRFALTVLLILTLMIVNAVKHLGDYRLEMNIYRKNVAKSLDHLRSGSENLYDLIEKGPGDFYKQPSPLSFCADGGESFLPDRVSAAEGEYILSWDVAEGNLGGIKGIWRLKYPDKNPNLRDIRPDYTQIDWVLVISVVLSFVAILFTFDAISGERERGTLRLILSNSVPRSQILIGKFLGALLSIGLPFLMGALINLFLLNAASHISLEASDWGQLGAIFLIALVYMSIFIALGLLISARVSQQEISLTILLLIWAFFVVLTPNTLGSIVSGLKPAQTREEFNSRFVEQYEELNTRYEQPYPGPTREFPPTRETELWAKYIAAEAELVEGLRAERLKTQIDQIGFARSIARVSPASIVQHAVETLAGTGLSRHLQFLDGVRRYAAQYREFLISADQSDPDSPHLYFVRQGMSEKPVPYSAVPKFEDRIELRESINAAMTDILLLILFLVVLFAGAVLAFVRVDVT